jgi:hypothetical protein
MNVTAPLSSSGGGSLNLLDILALVALSLMGSGRHFHSTRLNRKMKTN